MSAIRVNNAWKTPSIVYAKVAGQWRIVGETFANINGVWRSTTFASPPDKPIMTYVSTGVFQISNYDPTLTYETIFKTGSGSASFNSSNGRYTLSGTNSGFDVISRYVPGSPASAAGYMERKAYTYSCRQVSYTESYGCNCRLDAACYCTFPYGNCYQGGTPSWGQCGCGQNGTPFEMCWLYYNGVVCDTCTRTACCRTVCDVLINQPGYTNSGSEWYKAN